MKTILNKKIRYACDPVGFIEENLTTKENSPIILTDIQKEMLSTFQTHSKPTFTALASGRTTIGLSYILWEAMFYETSILIVSDTESRAKLLLDDLKWLYSICADDIKPLIVVDKSNIFSLANRSRIICGSIGDNFRGYSINIIYADATSGDQRVHNILPVNMFPWGQSKMIIMAD